MPDNNLQDIKDRLNVAEVIGGYIQLKKAGVNFKANCPFHGEKTPSLIVSPQKQIWHCFGCGEGGDIFGFVMRYENLEFKEALKLLAEKAGVKLTEYKPTNPQVEDEKKLLLRINNFAARFYHEILLNDKRGAEALEYLKQRGLTLGTIKKWQIGFAPEDFHVLEQALIKKKVSMQDMVKAGVTVKNERSQMFDRFRGRITFPIFNYFGEVVGFSARILKDDGKSAKYINSPETAIYNKSQTLFGLNFAKEETRKKDELIIVEGQMDCISLHQADFKNVIASSGTAYNQNSVAFTIARRLTKNIKLCFDADTAGQMAVRKVGELLLGLGFRVKVILLKSVKDPDELVKKNPGLWEKAVTEAIWFLDWQMDLAVKNFPEDLVEQKHFLTESVVPLLSSVSDPLEQDHYIRRIGERFGISERIISEQIKKYAKAGGKAVSQVIVAPDLTAPTVLLEKEILGGMYKFPEFCRLVSTETELEEFKTAEVKDVLKPLYQNPAGGLPQSALTVAKEALFMVESQLEEPGSSEAAVLKNLSKTFAQFKLKNIRTLLQDLNLKIKAAEQGNQIDVLKNLQQKFSQVSSLRLKYENQI